MKLPFTVKATETVAASSPWLWPTCVINPRTLSFRSNSNESTYQITSSACLEDHHDRNHIEFIDTPDSFFSATASFNSEISIIGHQNPNYDINDASAATAVIQGLKSNRLFFEPGETRSILEEAKTHFFPRAKSVEILAMDSRDPFTDFRVSMEEMVEAHGWLKDDWDCLEELLAYYLRVNCKRNHGYIVGAFVDLLVHLQHLAVSAKVSSSSAIDKRRSSSSTATHCSFTSHLSVPSSTCSSVSPCLSSLNED